MYTLYIVLGPWTNVNRQGVLPFTRFWTSTRPFGTPLGPYWLKWALTALMILAPPAGDAFNFGTQEECIHTASSHH